MEGSCFGGLPLERGDAVAVELSFACNWFPPKLGFVGGNELNISRSLSVMAFTLSRKLTGVLKSELAEVDDATLRTRPGVPVVNDGVYVRPWINGMKSK